MKAESSIHHPRPAVGAAPSLAPRASAKAQDKAAMSFASQVDTDAPSHVPPAQAARAALASRPDLAGRPFGAIVSLFARHQELPAAPGPAEPPAGDESEVADAPAAPEPTPAPLPEADVPETADVPAAPEPTPAPLAEADAPETADVPAAPEPTTATSPEANAPDIADMPASPEPTTAPLLEADAPETADVPAAPEPMPAPSPTGGDLGTEDSGMDA